VSSGGCCVGVHPSGPISTNNALLPRCATCIEIDLYSLDSSCSIGGSSSQEKARGCAWGSWTTQPPRRVHSPGHGLMGSWRASSARGLEDDAIVHGEWRAGGAAAGLENGDGRASATHLPGRCRPRARRRATLKDGGGERGGARSRRRHQLAAPAPSRARRDGRRPHCMQWSCSC
jgi:hypothetical protein